MTLHTALALAPLALALAMSPQSPRSASLVTAAALSAAAIATIGLLTSAYVGALAAADPASATVPAAAAAALLALAAGRLLRGDRSGLLEFLAQPYAGSRLVRNLLPLVLGVPLLFVWVRAAGEAWGWFDATLGVPMMAAGTAITLAALLIHSGRMLNDSEAERARLQQRAEQHLRESNEQLERRVAQRTADLAKANATLRTLVDAIPGVVYMKDEAGRLVLVNPAFEAAVGRSADSLLHCRVEQYAPDPAIAARASAIEQQVMRTGVPQTTEELIPTSGGLRRFWTTRVPYVEQGQNRGVIGFATDVTERMALAAAVEEREAQYKALVEHLPDAVVRLDRALRVAFANAAARSMVSRREGGGWLLGRSLRELGLPRSLRERLESAAARVFDAGESVVEEVELAARALRVRLVPEPGRDRAADTLLVIAEDISAQAEAERARERLLQAEREARERAEAARQAQDDILAVVSHELRTPLSAMMGWLRVLQRAGGAGSANLPRALEAIERNVLAQRRLVEDLLDAARMIGGQLRVAREPLSIGPLLRSAVDAAQPLADANGIGLALQREPGELRVAGDAARLEQVISNLLSNALKFTPRGGHVTVSLGLHGDQVVLAVQDTGIGLSADERERVFDRFWQADSSMTRRFGGLGLGLPLARHLVELHEGTLSADSDGRGLGSLFTIRLPRID
ncbi:MAG TPA: ATP-binding protein, partial [Burkholderiaceae bacterium]|nr:ATP-binding protein [Burkholderiaceae bacterium]